MLYIKTSNDGYHESVTFVSRHVGIIEIYISCLEIKATVAKP